MSLKAKVFKPKSKETSALDEEFKELEQIQNPEEDIIIRKVTKMELDDYIVFDKESADCECC